MSDTTDLFMRLRPRLHGIAYRMLGSPAEAEDVVQDAWLRWQSSPHDALESAEAWLVTITTRLAIDRLRSAQHQRERYVGTWLPEPLMADGAAPSPEALLERADDLSVAFLAVLERLAPEARAAFLLREVFDAGYDEVARTLDKSEAACRQIVHRARTQLQDARPRHHVPPEHQLRLLRGFADAAASGQFADLQALLAEDAQLVSDGGGKVPSFGVPLVGSRRIAQLYWAVHRRHGARVRYEVAVLSGQWSVLRFIDEALESAQTFQTDGRRIQVVHTQRNPDKLARIAAALGRPLAAVTGAVSRSS
ncbi:RNA polymerase sigma-70 factor [Pseudacidovorax sp. NFM-22]|uniref:RNA polymerase sigma-70 factor n=1 Tax=Pseudacidovorax sp. NFM-22 TaxID=2744469 RepID=UPI001F216667|nr:RNA polymerase sigma-70 factor [Pseudacidovorax sp. NFM-22]